MLSVRIDPKEPRGLQRDDLVSIQGEFFERGRAHVYTSRANEFATWPDQLPSSRRDILNGAETPKWRSRNVIGYKPKSAIGRVWKNI